MTRHAFVLPQQKLVVFWAPKAACSTLAEVIAFSVLSKDVLEAWNFDLGGPRLLLEKQGFLYDGKSARALASAHNYRTVAIIRDPYDRLISAFLNKFVVKNDRPIRAYSDMEPFAFRFIQDNYLALELEQPPDQNSHWRGLTFRQFVSVICDVIDASDEDQRHLNQHWNTQIPDGLEIDGYSFNQVYTLMTIDSFFREFQILTGVRIDIPNRNSSSYQDDASKNLCDINALRILDQGGYSKSCFEDVQLRNRVRTSFQTDYHYIAQAA